MERDPALVYDYLTVIEKLAQDILFDKEEIVKLDQKRNKNREALRVVANELKEKPCDRKAWMCFGSMFLKVPKEKAKVLIADDQRELDKEIDQLRDGLREKVFNLRNMEGQPQAKGFNLKPLSPHEAEAIQKVISP